MGRGKGEERCVLLRGTRKALSTFNVQRSPRIDQTQMATEGICGGRGLPFWPSLRSPVLLIHVSWWHWVARQGNSTAQPWLCVCVVWVALKNSVARATSEMLIYFGVGPGHPSLLLPLVPLEDSSTSSVLRTTARKHCPVWLLEPLTRNAGSLSCLRTGVSTADSWCGWQIWEILISVQGEPFRLCHH